MAKPLSWTETQDLVNSILEGIEAAETGTAVRPTWPNEMRDWCELLLDHQGEE